MPKTCEFARSQRKHAVAVVDTAKSVELLHPCGHTDRVHPEAVHLLKDSLCRECLRAYYDKETPF